MLLLNPKPTEEESPGRRDHRPLRRNLVRLRNRSVPESGCQKPWLQSDYVGFSIKIIDFYILGREHLERRPTLRLFSTRGCSGVIACLYAFNFKHGKPKL